MTSSGVLRGRRIRSSVGLGFATFCAAIGAALLLTIFAYVLVQGFASINWSFLVELPHPVGVPGGGVANGLVGTVIIVAIATMLATPVGVLTGVFLALFGRGSVVSVIRFLSDVLSGVPSIVIGLFAYGLLVAPFKHFSGISASVAFAIMMLPIIIGTAEGSIRSVPSTIREGALALGMTVYAATIKVILPVARPAIITGILLGVSRVVGETAPLLFTAFGTQFWELNPANPMAAIALQIFVYAISPYDDWHRQAWAGALVLIFSVFVLNVAARFAFRSYAGR